jgi:DNA-binding CsgD family transcriptional regulator
VVEVTLTPRQVQILRLIADGLTDQRIADRLHLSPHSVRKINYAMYAVLGARGRAHAVAIAYREGILELEPEERP